MYSLSPDSVDSDRYGFAEERRLFYVALTRTKNRVWDSTATSLGAALSLLRQDLPRREDTRGPADLQWIDDLTHRGFVVVDTRHGSVEILSLGWFIEGQASKRHLAGLDNVNQRDDLPQVDAHSAGGQRLREAVSAAGSVRRRWRAVWRIPDDSSADFAFGDHGRGLPHALFCRDSVW